MDEEGEAGSGEAEDVIPRREEMTSWVRICGVGLGERMVCECDKRVDGGPENDKEAEGTGSGEAS